MTPRLLPFALTSLSLLGCDDSSTSAPGAFNSAGDEAEACVVFTGTDGVEEDWTADWDAATPDAPYEALIEEDGTLSIRCEGTWYVSLELTGDVTVEGVGMNKTVLANNQNYRILEVDNGGSVRVQDLTLAGEDHDAAGGQGRGLHCRYSELTTHNIRITDQKATKGAGVWIHGCEVSIFDSLIEFNTATMIGGGIHMSGYSDLTIEGTTIKHNTAAYASAMLVYGSDARISSSNISGNEANYYGAVVMDHSGSVVAVDSTFDDNTLSSGSTSDLTLFSPFGAHTLGDVDAISCEYGGGCSDATTITSDVTDADAAGFCDSADSPVILDGAITISEDAEHLDGLDCIVAVTDDITLKGPSLQDIDGLSGLVVAGGTLTVNGSNALTDLDGLSSLAAVGAKVTIRDNDALADVSGLRRLSSAPDAVSFNNNDALTSLDGLDNLAAVADKLTVRDNDALTDVSGLRHLSTAGTMAVYNNDALTSLDPISRLASIDDGLAVNNNDSLCQTAAEAWADGIAVEGRLFIRNNSTDCD